MPLLSIGATAVFLLVVVVVIALSAVVLLIENSASSSAATPPSPDRSETQLTLEEELPATGSIPRLYEMEGGSFDIPAQREWLRQFVEEQARQGTPVRRVLEIGFNGGHSSEVLLRSDPNLTVTSFDLGDHEYVAVAKQAIDKAYPGRHTLILGDSRTTVPALLSQDPTPFDMMYIDGGHTLDVARADIANCRALAHPASVVIIDDFYDGEDEGGSNPGPTIAWKQAVATNMVQDIGGVVFLPTRGMRWGRYRLV